MPFGLGFGETMIIFAVFLLLFGAKRLPELASGMGKGIREFKRSVSGLDEASAPQFPESHDAPRAAPEPAAPAAGTEAAA